MKLRVAIIGAGRMGRERARATCALDGEVGVVCDTDTDRANALAAEFGAPAVTRLGEIPWRSMDAAFICVPPGGRGEAELKAIDAGIPVFVEKPIGLSAERSRLLLEALEKRPVINAVGYMNRYRQSVLQARELIAGRPAMGVVFHWFGTQYRVPWWLELEQSGGPLNEQCTHLIDLCRFFMGEVSAVSAMARPLSNKARVNGTFAMTLTFENGALGVGLYGAESARKQITFEVFFPESPVRLEGWDLRLNGQSEEDIFVRETEVFFKAIHHQRQDLILSDFKSAHRTQCVVDAVGRAVESGRRETPSEWGRLAA
jgi:predicted dehydrogenase